MAQCSLCRKEMALDEYASVGYIDHIGFICQQCYEHISNGGKFARIDFDNIRELGFTEELNNEISNWLAYKSELGDSYTDSGKKKLMTKIKNEVKATSEAVVIAKITESIKHNWKGICWDNNSYLKPDINKFFEFTWKMSRNTDNKEEARNVYISLFKGIDTLEKAKLKANKIYAFYRQCLDTWEDDRYVPTFASWLRKNIPQD